MDGAWERIHPRLREETRQRHGRERTPSGAIIDSQSVKNHGNRRPTGSDGYDAGKKVTGRKRHLLVDTQGLVLKALVQPANVPDRDGGRLLLEGMPDLPTRFSRLRHLWVDADYRGRFVTWVRETYGWSVQVVKHWWTGLSGVWVFPGQAVPEIPVGFQILPWRWIVERTFARLGRSRRLSKDYEFLLQTSEIMISLAMIRLMLRRLARTP